MIEELTDRELPLKVRSMPWIGIFSGLVLAIVVLTLAFGLGGDAEREAVIWYAVLFSPAAAILCFLDWRKYIRTDGRDLHITRKGIRRLGWRDNTQIGWDEIVRCYQGFANGDRYVCVQARDGREITVWSENNFIKTDALYTYIRRKRPDLV